MSTRLVWTSVCAVLVTGLLGAAVVSAQELGGAGNDQGTVKDPTGAVMVAVTVTVANPVSGFRRETTTDQTGRFVFRNLPPNNYHVAVAAQGSTRSGRTWTCAVRCPSRWIFR